MEKSMTQGAPWKLILRFALPIMAGNFLQQLYNTADTIIVGRIKGGQALSAVGTCNSLTMLFTALAIGLSIGVGVLIVQYFGAKRYEELRDYAATAISLMLMLGLAASVIASLFAKVLLKHILNTPADILPLAVCYFRIYGIGLIFQFGYNVVAAILRAVGDSKATLLFLMISAVLNILLDVFFVAMIDLGVTGAAVATVISQICACFTAFGYMHRKHTWLRFGVRQIRMETEKAKHILSVGCPMALQQLVVSCSFVMLQRLVNSYGESMMASYTVACKVENILKIPVIGIQNTMATYAGQNMGAKKPERVSKGLGQGALVSFCMAFALSALLFVFTPQIISLFGIDMQATEYCMQHLRSFCVAILLFAVYFPANGVFQGVGSGFFAMFCAVLALGLCVVFAYALHTSEFFGYRAIWWSQAMAWSVTIVVCYTHYFRGTWKQTTLVKEH